MKTKYTKKQRHEIYKRWLNISTLSTTSLPDYINKRYPESKGLFWKKFPEIALVTGNFYLSERSEKSTNDHRQILLMFCIKMTR